MGAPTTNNIMSVPGPQNTQTGEPSLVHGHVNLARGAFDSTVGAATGAQDWTDSGETAKMEGIQELKSYGEKNPAQQEGSSMMGKAEEALGQATGCGGMEKEGEVKQDSKPDGSKLV